MGRSRMRPASTAASTIDRPRSRSCSANSTIRIEFLAARPISMTRPTWQNTSLASPRRSWAPRPPMTARGTPSRMMNGQHPALVLRGQDQVHEDQAEREDVDRLRARLDLFERLAGPGEVESRRQGFPRDPLHGLERLARAHAGRGRAVDLRGAEQVEVADDLGRHRLARAHHAVEGHHGAVRGAGVELAQVLGVGAVLLVGLHVHAVGAVVEVEVVHVGRAQEHLERVRDLAQRQVQAARLVAVDVDHELRVVGAEAREEPDDPAALVGAGGQGAGGVGQAGDLPARLVEQLVLEAAEDGEALDAGRRERDHQRPRNAPSSDRAPGPAPRPANGSSRSARCSP